MGRLLKDLVQKVEDQGSRNVVGFRSLHENIDTTSPVGKFQFHVFSALPEFGRDLIRKRTLAGLHAARARGRKGGHKRGMTRAKVHEASQLIQNKQLSIKQICKILSVSHSTRYQYVGPSGDIQISLAD